MTVHNDQIPALERGLRVIDFLLSSPSGGRRYSEIKLCFTGITDASLNRLLKALMASNVLMKAVDGRYCLSTRISRWGELLTNNLQWRDRVVAEVDSLAAAAAESAAFGLLETDRIEIVHSCSWRDSIMVIEPGEVLHFESDHAGSIAVLSRLPTAEIERLIRGPFSRIDQLGQVREAVDKWRYEGAFKDCSARRPGISRIAVAVQVDDIRAGCLFYCLPTLRAERRSRELAELLEDGRLRLERG